MMVLCSRLLYARKTRDNSRQRWIKEPACKRASERARVHLRSNMRTDPSAPHEAKTSDDGANARSYTSLSCAISCVLACCVCAGARAAQRSTHETTRGG